MRMLRSSILPIRCRTGTRGCCCCCSPDLPRAALKRTSRPNTLSAMAIFFALSCRTTPERCGKAPDDESCGAVSTPQQRTPKAWPPIPSPRAERKEGTHRFTFKLMHHPDGESVRQILLKKIHLSPDSTADRDGHRWESKS